MNMINVSKELNKNDRNEQMTVICFRNVLL